MTFHGQIRQLLLAPPGLFAWFRMPAEPWPARAARPPTADRVARVTTSDHVVALAVVEIELQGETDGPAQTRTMIAGPEGLHFAEDSPYFVGCSFLEPPPEAWFKELP